jgi:hypothetical protein
MGVRELLFELFKPRLDRPELLECRYRRHGPLPMSAGSFRRGLVYFDDVQFAEIYFAYTVYFLEACFSSSPMNLCAESWVPVTFPAKMSSADIPGCP